MEIKVPPGMEKNAFFIVRYGELGLKSGPVQRRFLNRLRSNMEKIFLEADIDCYLDFARGRLYAYPGDLVRGAEIMTKTFGVVSISPGISIDTSDLDEISAKAVEYSQWLFDKGDSFAVRTRRVGNHPYTSQEVNVRVGSEILTNNTEKELGVKLSSPDKTLHIEIRDNTAFFYQQSIPGPGGLPLGVSGSSVCALGNEASLLAAYLMMKRGNRLHLFYVPQIYRKPLSKEEVLAYMDRFILRPEMEEMQEASRDDIFGILDAECSRKGARAIVLGFDLDGFTEILEEYEIKPTEHPAFYPVIGFSKDMIREMFADTLPGKER